MDLSLVRTWSLSTASLSSDANFSCIELDIFTGEAEAEAAAFVKVLGV